MSECVVRMERVPKNCDDGCWGSLSGECPWCDSIDGHEMVGNRPLNCPIIAVLPEGHGRLVDADALHKIAWPVKDHTGRIEECVQMRDLYKAPTIVPVERSET